MRALLVFFCFLTIAIHAQPTHFSLADINKLTSISSIQISPDGKEVLFMTSKRNLETNSFDRALIVLNIASKNQTHIGDTLTGISAPGWTPGGQSISFIANGDSGRQLQVMEWPAGNVKSITQSETGIVRYAWSPDGTQLAYLAKERKEAAGTNQFNNSFEVGSNDYLVDSPPLNTSVWLANADGSNPRKITPNDFTVATGLTTSALSWSADGQLLAFTAYPSSFSGDSDLGRNYLYHLADHSLHPATSNTDMESGPLFSPDAQSLLYRYPRNGFPSNMSEWYEVNLATGSINNKYQSLDRLIRDVHWLADGTTLLRGTDHWGNVMWHLKEGKYTKMALGNLVSVSDWSIAGNGSMVLTAAEKNYPGEVYYKANFSAPAMALTEFNREVRNFDLGRQEGFQWKSSDGLSPNGILTYPPDFDAQKQYPLVLLIHGGPSSASLLGFNPIAQAMAAKGWIIFQPNYRGSTNQGNAFQSAISEDPSEGPGHDVMTGVEALKLKPYIDSQAICVSGWSYGGWMTAWLIGRYPEMWKSAVAGAAPVDLTDMYSLNDLNRMKRHAMIYSPYVGDKLDWAYKNSPISNFSRIKTPTLIMSKTGDYRVTITGSYKLYGALRDNDVPVQFIAYPGPGHFPSDPVRYMDVYHRWMDWLEHHLSKESKGSNVKKP